MLGYKRPRRDQFLVGGLTGAIDTIVEFARSSTAVKGGAVAAASYFGAKGYGKVICECVDVPG